MRLLLGGAGAFLLLALLTFLLLRGLTTNAPDYAAVLRAFDDFSLAEASLHRDVLKARAGLLRNYDALVKDINDLEDAAGRLRARAFDEGLDLAPANRLTTMIAEQQELIESFKGGNALLQNSLSYVGLLSTSQAFGARDAQLAAATGALAAVILHLTRDTSPEVVKALQESIGQFAVQAPSTGPDAEAAQALLAHARLLYDLLPAVDRAMKTLVATPSNQPLEEIRTLFFKHQSTVEATAERFRLALYAVSLLLLIMVVGISLRLRARAIALRRRAAFEHVIAENSTRLINCPPAETEARLRQVLGEFGLAMGVERAYVVLAENPARISAWSAEGITYPPGWPDRALVVSEQLGGAEHNVVSMPNAARMPPGEVKDILAEASIRSFACVPLLRPGRVRGIMGFDAFRPSKDTVFPAAVMRLAGDAVANAIEREFLDRERMKLTSRLERARRMQTIGSLASGIAHNFNNIIAAILGYSEMIETQLTPGTKPAVYIDEVRRAAERGRDLIDNILSFGRRREARVRPVPVRNLLDEAASLLHASLPSDITLTIDEVTDDVAVTGESAQLQQVILNLCSNAAQAMEGKGFIHVTVERKDVTAPLLLSHGEIAPGCYVCLAITDTGRGFDAGVARRLFEPFFTTRLAGTGLGLATVQEIVCDHEGAMNVKSTPGYGSRFEAWLPIAMAGSAPGAVSTSLPLGGGETVLIIESERERLLRDEEMLAALGYEPVGFERPEDALAACQLTPNRFDVILVSYPSKISGVLELARALHKIAPRQPLLVATSCTFEISVDTVEEAVIAGVLRRPLVSTELAAALVRCLRYPVAVQK
jgi:signal transduction histidine kinase